jgi:hypothetical protein
MTDSKQFDLPQLEKLVATATNPRQKAMYQALLDKAKSQIKQEQLASAQAEDEPKAETKEAKETTETEAKSEEEAEPSIMFQGIGIISGQVQFSDDGENTITIGNQTYSLYYVPSKRRAWEALKKEIDATGKTQQRLIVYPKAIHFPKKEDPHRIAFQLVGFDKGKEEKGITDELQDLEFKLCGLWQFIPVCRVPCISILRNFTKERLEYIKQAEPARKVRFMKASHIPLFWKDSPVKPFRFNPKAGKEQGHPAFVQVKAKFMPGRDVFGFVAQLADAQETAPRFLKASKKDKSEALQAKAEQKKSES